MLRACAFALTAAAFLGSPGCAGVASESTPEDEVSVVAAFYPLEWAAEGVGGGLIAVENLTAPGVEPHDLELTASQVRTLSEADLVVYLGGGFQPALEDVVSSLDRTRLMDVHADVSAGASGVPADDPHLWLDPALMASIVAEIAARFAELDSDNAATFQANASRLESELTELDRDFAAALESCRRRDIVTSHAAFGYLAARYGLNQISISGVDPESEPSPGRLAEVARFVEANKVSTIFFEELVSPEIAETIAAETGASTSMLSPLESRPEAGDYITAMRANLRALAEALACD